MILKPIVVFMKKNTCMDALYKTSIIIDEQFYFENNLQNLEKNTGNSYRMLKTSLTMKS